jgi:hypothetical protein
VDSFATELDDSGDFTSLGLWSGDADGGLSQSEREK